MIGECICDCIARKIQKFVWFASSWYKKKMLLTSFLGLYCKLQNLVLPLGFKARAR